MTVKKTYINRYQDESTENDAPKHGSPTWTFQTGSEQTLHVLMM